MDLAYFPRELECTILEVAANSDSTFIPTLLLVARRAHVWLEPLLYRQVYISTDPDFEWKRAQDAFFRIAASKAPSFLAKSVRFVILELQDRAQLSQHFLDCVYSALWLCTGVEEIAVNGSHILNIGPTLLPIFSAMPLRRLGVFLEDLIPHPTPMKGHAPAFSALTHLDVYDNEGHSSRSRDLVRIIPFLTALPNLTHLAIHVPLDSYHVKQILDGCSRLQILAFVTCAIYREPSPFMESVQYLAESLGDARILGTTFAEWMEVLSMVAPSFWRALDILIDQKKQGLIDDKHASTGDFWNKDTRDCIAKQIRGLI
ncbi:hypothetical protein MIND_00116300 [Mycena indigotica]|uniref:Uncharacterized protein n=1 Tax=Mycena indigotica TaxID=2126181 RepID=A0A8H6TEG9_9AGAR|nr:uncharacterized protein MIND_00116300 [Mycena indigotica]KAF7315990.1 hypothetical protein MIND_00116300 [Mycena indigotica]